MKTRRFLKLTIIALSIPMTIAAASTATASRLERKHPRRAEVNSRSRDQEKRIDAGVKDGSLTQDQATQLRGDEVAIKAQEHGEVKAGGGRLTKAQQQQLNASLKQESQKIYAERHPQPPSAP